MLKGALEGWHVVIILGLFVLLFGARKLPDAARSIGQSLRIFKSEMRAAGEEASPPPQPAAAPLAVENLGAGTAAPTSDTVHTTAQV